jgi:hypothetical protein
MIENVLTLIQENRLADAFALADTIVSNSPQYEVFKQEFIAGKASYDYHERLIIFFRNYKITNSLNNETDTNIVAKKIVCEHCEAENIEILGKCSHLFCQEMCCSHCGEVHKGKFLHKEGWCINGINIYNKSNEKN